MKRNGLPAARPAELPPGWALRRYEVALILAGWSAVGIVFTGQLLAYTAQIGLGWSIWQSAAVAFTQATAWAMITIVAFALSRRFPLDQKPRLARLLIHTVASMVLATMEVVIEYGFGVIVRPVRPGPFMEAFFQGFPFNVVVVWMMVGVAHGLMFYRRYRERDAQAAALTSRLALAELQVLKSQLHPHFLFNALNTISALMHRDVKSADRMIARLSDLLRAALEHTAEQEVSLLEELNFLESYLEIERTRLADRLTIEVDVPPNVLDARVPHMILQPLVENAIRYGVAPRAAPGHVTIRARGRRDMLDIEVLDDGPGMRPGRSPNGGLGLANTFARLQKLYGEQFSFEPRNRAEGGFRVSLSIPFDPIDEDVAAE